MHVLYRLHRTQELLYDSTRDLLSVRAEHRENERRWMVDKDRLLQELDACHQRLQTTHRDQIHGQAAQTPPGNVLDVSAIGLHEDLLRHEDFKVVCFVLLGNCTNGHAYGVTPCLCRSVVCNACVVVKHYD